MTDLRQAAQQALEALCSAVEPKNGKVYARGFEPIDCYAMHEQAIAALRTALAMHQVSEFAQAQEQAEPLTATSIVNMMPSQIPSEYDGPLMEFARAIEAAHNIKEQP